MKLSFYYFFSQFERELSGMLLKSVGYFNIKTDGDKKGTVKRKGKERKKEFNGTLNA